MSGKKERDDISNGLSCDILYLCSCALHGIKPNEEKTSRMDIQKLYRMCQFHKLTAMVCMALEKTDVFSGADPAAVKKWKEAKAKAIRKNMLLDAERGQIMEKLEQAGIWHMPLKGSILQELYPKYGMRQMADNDILYDPSGQARLVEIMKERGYQVESCGKSHHDVFMKEPIYNYEMHTSLFEQFSDGAWYHYYNVWYQYYKNIKDKLLLDAGSSFRYHFTDEDFYLYLTAHTYKHYKYSGVGLRALVDAYVYITAKKDVLDWDYIAREAGKLQMADFEKQSRRLAEKLFSAPVWPPDIPFTQEEKTMLSYFADSGAYGTTQNYVRNRLRETQAETNNGMWKSKIYYVYRRLFPTMKWYQKNEPFLAKHRVLIPFFLVYRFFRRLFGKRNIRKELRAMKEYSNEK